MICHIAIVVASRAHCFHDCINLAPREILKNSSLSSNDKKMRWGRGCHCIYTQMLYISLLLLFIYYYYLLIIIYHYIIYYVIHICVGYQHQQPTVITWCFIGFTQSSILYVKILKDIQWLNSNCGKY